MHGGVVWQQKRQRRGYAARTLSRVTTLQGWIARAPARLLSPRATKGGCVVISQPPPIFCETKAATRFNSGTKCVRISLRVVRLECVETLMAPSA